MSDELFADPLAPKVVKVKAEKETVYSGVPRGPHYKFYLE